MPGRQQLAQAERSEQCGHRRSPRDRSSVPALQWCHNMLLIIIICSALVGLGKVAWHALANHETVPYTSRKHTVLLPPMVERAMGQHAMARVQKRALCQGHELLKSGNKSYDRVDRVFRRIAPLINRRDGAQTCNGSVHG